jgi:ADP-ribose pyrophosphatase YjhB (NUDIX family)
LAEQAGRSESPRDRRSDLLRWAQRIRTLAQTGLTYAEDPYDRERYEELRELSIQMAAADSDLPVEEVREAFTREQGYPTPKLDVRAVVFRGDEILLVRERASGRWTFPGGWADAGDTPAETAQRETAEESGYRVRAEKLLALLDKARHEHPPSLHYVYKALIRCRLDAGEPIANHEIDAVGFFARGALPELDLERTTPGQVELAYAHLADPKRPADFD